MPSVTVTTVPTLRASLADLKFSMRDLMRSLISDALTDMFESSEKLYAVSSVARRSSRPLIEPSITRSPALRTAPPSRLPSTLVCRRTLAPQLLLQRRRVAAFLVGRELTAADHFDIHRVLDVGLHLLEQRRDLGEESEPAVLREQRHEVAAVLVESRTGHTGHELGELRRRHVRAAQQAVHDADRATTVAARSGRPTLPPACCPCVPARRSPSRTVVRW